MIFISLSHEYGKSVIPGIDMLDRDLDQVLGLQVNTAGLG
jgi:hypothetical protein